jgi:nucleoside-diphosphate-sugar epimerase
MLTVLLTGITSFIGRHLAHHLAQSDIKVVATYRSDNQHQFESQLANFRTLELIQLDLLEEIGFDRLPSTVDAVVHVAGVSAAPNISNDQMLAINVAGTRNVQRYATRAKACKFIYCSSLSIHGIVNSGIVDERTPIFDPTLYGATKYLGERILEEVSDCLPTIAIRLPGVLGPGAHRAWIPTLVDKMVSSEDVSIHSPNAGFNNAVHVHDLSKFIIQVLRKQSWHGFAAFPIGAAGEMTISEIAHLLQNRLASTSRLLEVDSTRQPFVIDSIYAVKHFGYVPTPIETLLLHYLDDLSSIKSRKFEVDPENGIVV